MSGPHDELDPTEDTSAADLSKMEQEMLAALREGQPQTANLPLLDGLKDQFRELNSQAWTPWPSGERVRYLGDYELIAELGRGGMGIVYHARQLSLKRDVAVKMVQAATYVPRALQHRFRTEAEAAAKLDHPNIVPVYEVGEHEGQPYFSMRLIRGSSLSAAKQRWRLDLPTLDHAERRERSRQVASLAETLALAIHHAHQHGVLHRDLKPSNILIDEDSVPYITDFGLAKLLDATSDTTLTGALLGTPMYMAPEQARGSRDITTAVDVYGLGVILYEMLTGRPPYPPGSSAETLKRVCESEPVRPRVHVPALDRDLETICLKCLARDRKDRYASADALAEDLRRYRHGEPILARRISLFERMRKWARRRPAAALLVFVLISASVCLAAGLVVSNLLISAERRNTERAFVEQNRATYLRTVALAHLELRDNNPGRAQYLLDRCQPALRDWEWYYTWRRVHDTYRRVSHGRGYFFDVAYSLDGQFLVALVSDISPIAPYYPRVSIVVFDAVTGDKLRSLEASDVDLDRPNGWWWPRIALSPDSRQVALAGFTTVDGDPAGVVRRWNLMTGESLPVEPATFPGREMLGAVFDSQGKCFAVSREPKVVEKRDEAVLTQVHNLETGQLQCEFTVSARQGSPQLSPDDRWISVGCGGVDVMDFASGERVAGIPLPRASKRQVFSRDGTLLAAVDNGGTLYMHDLPSGDRRWSIPAHPRGAMSVAFARADTELVTVGREGTVKRWRVEDGHELASMAVPGTPMAVAGHPRTGDIAFPLPASELAIWTPDNDQALQLPLDVAVAYPQQIVATDDGSRLVVLENQERVSVWDLRQRELIWRRVVAETAAMRLVHLALSPNGRFLAATIAHSENEVGGGPVRIWDLESGEKFAELPTGDKRGRQCVWNANSDILAATFADQVMIGWDIASQRELWRHVCHDESVPMRHPATGQLYVSQQRDLTETVKFHVLDFRTGRLMKTLDSRRTWLFPSRFSPDGRWILSSCFAHPSDVGQPSKESGIVLVNSRTAVSEEEWPLGGSWQSPHDIHLSRDGKRLFAMSDKGEILVLDRATGEVVVNLRNPRLDFHRFTLLPDGLIVAGTFSRSGLYLLDGRPLTDSPNGL